MGMVDEVAGFSFVFSAFFFVRSVDDVVGLAGAYV
jgi:hypothetical protein